MIPTSEIPDIMIALCIVALDASIAPELQREVMVAIDRLGHSLSGDSGTPAELVSSSISTLSSMRHCAFQEVLACTKIAQFAKGLSPTNKAYLMSFMMGGSLQTERMARWIARTLLFDGTVMSPVSCCQLLSHFLY